MAYPKPSRIHTPGRDLTWGRHLIKIFGGNKEINGDVQGQIKVVPGRSMSDRGKCTGLVCVWRGWCMPGIGTMTTAQGPLGLFSAGGDTCSALSSCPPRNQATAVAVSVNPQPPSVEKPCLLRFESKSPCLPRRQSWS